MDVSAPTDSSRRLLTKVQSYTVLLGRLYVRCDTQYCIRVAVLYISVCASGINWSRPAQQTSQTPNSE